MDERKRKKREAIPIYKDKIIENLRIRISDSHRKASWYFMMRVASGEVMRLMPGKQQANYTFVKELGIFDYSGRLLNLENMEIKDCDRNIYYDVPELNFVVPVVMYDMLPFSRL